MSDEYVKASPFEASDIMQIHWKDSAKKRIYHMQQMTGNIHNIIDCYKTYSRSDGYYFVSLRINIMQYFFNNFFNFNVLFARFKMISRFYIRELISVADGRGSSIVSLKSSRIIAPTVVLKQNLENLIR